MGISLLNAHSYRRQARDSTNNLNCDEGNQFLSRISSIDDTWLRSFEQE